MGKLGKWEFMGNMGNHGKIVGNHGKSWEIMGRKREIHGKFMVKLGIHGEIHGNNEETKPNPLLSRFPSITILTPYTYESGIIGHTFSEALSLDSKSNEVGSSKHTAGGFLGMCTTTSVTKSDLLLL